ncbi:hypothetical protein [Flavobacterium nackdongense]|uniref:hypothetical protein n=1 Tax=Flavobacterium nackdongense TaxID=2547394 RepID=UPI0013FCF8B6|nr:hypothetical protein [Flavobacterium nackdongense]
MDTKKRTRQDEIIDYLLNSKKQLQEEIKNDVHTKEFQDALKELRARKEKRKNAV